MKSITIYGDEYELLPIYANENGQIEIGRSKEETMFWIEWEFIGYILAPKESDKA